MIKAGHQRIRKAIGEADGVIDSVSMLHGPRACTDWAQVFRSSGGILADAAETGLAIRLLQVVGGCRRCEALACSIERSNAQPDAHTGATCNGSGAHAPSRTAITP